MSARKIKIVNCSNLQAEGLVIPSFFCNFARAGKIPYRVLSCGMQAGAVRKKFPPLSGVFYF